MSSVGSIKTAELDGVAMTKEAFKTFCRQFGLKGSDFGAEFSTRPGARYKIIGLRPSERKYTVITKRLGDTKEFMFSHFHVVALLLAEKQTEEL